MPGKWEIMRFVTEDATSAMNMRYSCFNARPTECIPLRSRRRGWTACTINPSKRRCFKDNVALTEYKYLDPIACCVQSALISLRTIKCRQAISNQYGDLLHSSMHVTVTKTDNMFLHIQITYNGIFGHCHS